jgi:hypothetical protein
LIQRLNVKTGVAVAVRNLTYYIYRCSTVSIEQHQKHVVLFVIWNECKQRATTKNTWHCLLSRTTVNKNNAKNTWHCLLSWTTVNKSKTKKHMALFAIMNYGK